MERKIINLRNSAFFMLQELYQFDQRLIFLLMNWTIFVFIYVTVVFYLFSCGILLVYIYEICVICATFSFNKKNEPSATGIGYATEPEAEPNVRRGKDMSRVPHGTRLSYGIFFLL